MKSVVLEAHFQRGFRYGLLCCWPRLRRRHFQCRLHHSTSAGIERIATSSARCSPFHHHEPRDTAIPALLVGVARSRTRFIEVGEGESKCEEFSHVSCKRAMPVNDANAGPFYPLRKLLQVSIDPIVQVSSIHVLDPSIRQLVTKLFRFAIKRVPLGRSTRTISCKPKRKSVMSKSVK